MDEVLDPVGLTTSPASALGASRSAWATAGIAAALLADPGTLILDEPVHGLDPEGIRWIRTLLEPSRRRAGPSSSPSHLMSEIALTADHVVVVGQGGSFPRRCIGRVDLVAQASANAAVFVRSAERSGELARALAGPGVRSSKQMSGALEVLMD